MYYWLLIIDDWWLIIHTLYIFSGVHQATQVPDDWWCSHGKHGWNGCPQADDVGEHESSEFKQNLNGGMSAGGRGWWTAIIKNWTAIKRKKYISADATEGHGRWWLMTDYWLLIIRKFIKLRKFLMIDYWLSSHGTCGGHGGPQADGVGERESSEFKRNLNGGP